VSSRNVFDLVVCLASIQTLDQLLSKENKQLANRWTPTVRNQLVEIWDRGQGTSKDINSGWMPTCFTISMAGYQGRPPSDKDHQNHCDPLEHVVADTDSNGVCRCISLYELKQAIRFQSRHAGLSWDVCLCGSLLGFYKPYGFHTL
jgi:hypothetical protein